MNGKPISVPARHQPARPPLSRWIRWAQKGGFAILDQGLFAGTNFIVSILLARWLPPAQYGAFATAYSLFLLLGTFHTALLTEPMLIFGPGKYTRVFRRYLALLLYGHTGMTTLISLILTGVAGLFYLFGSRTGAQLAAALCGLAAAAPGILLLWVVRRAFYVHVQPQWAAIGGVLYLLLTMVGIFVVQRLAWLSAFSALVVMGISSALVGVWLIHRLRPAWTRREPTAREVLAAHWAYGRWSTGTALLIWLPGNIYFALSPVWMGLEGSAALKAIMNLILPVQHINSAVTVLLSPLLVKASKAAGREGLASMVYITLSLFAVSSAAYWGLLAVLRSQIIEWLYKGQYAEYSNLLLAVGLLPFFGGMTASFGSALRAIERPDLVFWCYVAATVVALTVGLWLLATQGVKGAVIGTLASNFVTATLMIALYARQGQHIEEEMIR
jgi:O-antigen/teichoic acid export membrane protein